MDHSTHGTAPHVPEPEPEPLFTLRVRGLLNLEIQRIPASVKARVAWAFTLSCGAFGTYLSIK